MRVIIPAGGLGKRFKDAGYTVPKPLIDVCGKPMIQHVIDRVQCVDKCPIVIARRPVAWEIGDNVSGTSDFIVEEFTQPQQGAALTLLRANGLVPDDEPVMIVACDDIIDSLHFEAFARQAAAAVKDLGAGMILTTNIAPEEDRGQWSYVLTDEKGDVTHVYEKASLFKTSRVTCGANVFPSWRQLRHAIARMLVFEDYVNGELYIAPAFNYCGFPVMYHDIPREAFCTVGTPEALKAYVERQKTAHARG